MRKEILFIAVLLMLSTGVLAQTECDYYTGDAEFALPQIDILGNYANDATNHTYFACIYSLDEESGYEIIGADNLCRIDEHLFNPNEVGEHNYTLAIMYRSREFDFGTDQWITTAEGADNSQNSTFTVCEIPEDTEGPGLFEGWIQGLTQAIQEFFCSYFGWFCPPEPIEPDLYAGVRSTLYGYQQEEEPEYWVNTINDISSKFDNSVPSEIYGIGGVWDNGWSYLNFPHQNNVQFVSFSDVDENEEYLDAFDESGAKIWLQVEPGMANVTKLIELILTQYSHHESVIGFGVDVEWLGYPSYSEGRKVTDTEVIQWLNKVKSYNPNYKLFLKHWEPSKMPNNYPADVVFVDDSENHGNFNNFINEMNQWADMFSDAEVGFQVGYPSDKTWWDDYEDPIEYIGDSLKEENPNMKYYYWVDFSIKDLYP